MKSLMLLKLLTNFLRSYVYRRLWKISKSRVLLFEFISYSYEDSGYKYRNFSLLPELSFQHRCFIMRSKPDKRNKSNKRYFVTDFDYFLITFSFLSFLICITIQKQY